MPEQVFEAVGCDTCRNTGYSGRGRNGVFEVLVGNDEFNRWILNKTSDLEWRAVIRCMGAVTLTGESILQLIEDMTSTEETSSFRWLL